MLVQVQPFGRLRAPDKLLSDANDKHMNPGEKLEDPTGRRVADKLTFLIGKSFVVPPKPHA